MPERVPEATERGRLYGFPKAYESSFSPHPHSGSVPLDGWFTLGGWFTRLAHTARLVASCCADPAAESIAWSRRSCWLHSSRRALLGHDGHAGFIVVEQEQRVRATKLLAGQTVNASALQQDAKAHK